MDFNIDYFTDITNFYFIIISFSFSTYKISFIKINFEMKNS